MEDSTKILNVLNMCRMELHREKLKKMDKTINYDKIQLLEKIIAAKHTNKNINNHYEKPRIPFLLAFIFF